MCVRACVCVCVCVRARVCVCACMFMWFMTTQIFIMTWYDNIITRKNEVRSHENAYK